MEERLTDTTKHGTISFLISKRALTLLIFIAAACTLFSIIFPDTFGTFENFSTIFLNMSAEAFIVIALVPLLISGEIDLSMGSIMALGGILCGRFMILGGMNMWLAIFLTVVISLVCGFINGFIVSKLKVVSFIATLATGMIYLGIAIMMAGTGWTDFPNPLFKALGQTKIIGLQLPIFYMLIAFTFASLLMSRNRYFRQYYYIGGSAKAAELSGINTERTKMTAYIIAAGLASIAGIISAMRFNSAITSVGMGVEMRAVTAAVIGGVAFTGGAGTMTGAAMGALFVACLNNVLTICNVSPNLQYVITGMVLILAIIMDVMIAKRKA